ncbi:MAG TPA: MFS transporter [Dehalococcoidia bacterium]|nr:MFS transporter [Dehalococcoidia bacterium]
MNSAVAKRYFIFVIVSSGLLMASIDATIVAVALPAMLKDLHTSLALVTWSLTSYQLTQTIALPMAGKLAERWGKKQLFLGAVALFSLGSIGAGLAPTIYMQIVFRVMQGIGGGMFFPSAAGVVSDVFEENRHTAVGLFVTIFQVGGIIGPNVGGLITDSLSWRWIFFVNIPLGIAILILGAAFIPRDRSMESEAVGEIDYTGISLFAAGMFALLFGMTNMANHPDRMLAPESILFLSLGLALLVAFYVVETRVREPIIDMSLIRWRPLFASNTQIFLWSGAFNGFFNFVPYYATVAYSMSAAESGAVLTPRAFTAAVVSLLGSVFLIRFGYRKPWLVGIYCLAACMVLASLGIHDLSVLGVRLSDFSVLAVIMCLGGFGVGIAAPSSQNAHFDLLPDRISAAAGLRAMFGNSGAVVGTTMVTLVLGHFANKAVGMQYVFLGLAAAVLLSQVCVFFVPDAAKQRREQPMASQTLAAVES